MLLLTIMILGCAGAQVITTDELLEVDGLSYYTDDMYYGAGRLIHVVEGEGKNETLVVHNASDNTSFELIVHNESIGIVSRHGDDVIIRLANYTISYRIVAVDEANDTWIDVEMNESEYLASGYNESNVWYSDYSGPNHSYYLLNVSTLEMTFLHRGSASSWDIEGTDVSFMRGCDRETWNATLHTFTLLGGGNVMAGSREISDCDTWKRPLGSIYAWKHGGDIQYRDPTSGDTIVLLQDEDSDYHWLDGVRGTEIRYHNRFELGYDDEWRMHTHTNYYSFDTTTGVTHEVPGYGLQFGHVELIRELYHQENIQFSAILYDPETNMYEDASGALRPLRIINGTSYIGLVGDSIHLVTINLSAATFPHEFIPDEIVYLERPLISIRPDIGVYLLAMGAIISLAVYTAFRKFRALTLEEEPGPDAIPGDQIVVPTQWLRMDEDLVGISMGVPLLVMLISLSFMSTEFYEVVFGEDLMTVLIIIVLNLRVCIKSLTGLHGVAGNHHFRTTVTAGGLSFPDVIRRFDQAFPEDEDDDIEGDPLTPEDHGRRYLLLPRDDRVRITLRSRSLGGNTAIRIKIRRGKQYREDLQTVVQGFSDLRRGHTP